MKRNSAVILSIIFTVIAFSTLSLPQNQTQPKIDPLLFVALKECRNITDHLQDQLFEGWNFRETPVLFYRPNVQEVLINYPHKPAGFSVYTGFNPLGNETIYYRNDTTIFSIDDQNTSRELEGIPVLVVADPFSSMRNKLQDVLNRPADFAARWLQEWNFIPSPYHQLQIILHEAFHVYQDNMAPGKTANEMAVAQYPLLDPVNNTLYVMEGNILRDALLAEDSKVKLEKIRQFVAVRSFRQSRLDSTSAVYENLNEFSEGLAKYIEYKFMQLGESIEPVKEMYYHQGFNGYKGVLPVKFREALDNMVNIVSVSDDRFGNKFGSGPLRFRLYDLGACQGLLLDEVMPGWKKKVFRDSVFLCSLLKEAVPLTAEELEQYLQKAKADYNYADVYESRISFEAEGKKQIQQKLSNILETRQTLIKIFYGGFVERIRFGFTPFGVTQITAKSAIYDLVPINIMFKEGSTAEMKEVVPVLIDRDKKMIAFAVQTPASVIEPDDNKKLETKEFVLSGCDYDLKKEGNVIQISLK